MTYKKIRHVIDGVIDHNIVNVSFLLQVLILIGNVMLISSHGYDKMTMAPRKYLV